MSDSLRKSKVWCFVAQRCVSLQELEIALLWDLSKLF